MKAKSSLAAALAVTLSLFLAPVASAQSAVPGSAALSSGSSGSSANGNTGQYVPDDYQEPARPLLAGSSTGSSPLDLLIFGAGIAAVIHLAVTNVSELRAAVDNVAGQLGF